MQEVHSDSNDVKKAKISSTVFVIVPPSSTPFTNEIANQTELIE